MLFDKEKFCEFISNVKNPKSGSYSIISYTQTINYQDFLRAQEILNSKQKFFYWSFPKEKYSFIACGQVFRNSYGDSQKFNLVDQDFMKISTSVLTNRNANIDSKHPLFVAGIKFPSNKKESIWNDFETSNWFIPKILLLKSGDEHYLSVNLKLPCENERKYSEEIEQFLSPHYPVSGINSDYTGNNIKRHDIIPPGKIEEWNSQINAALKIISDGKVKKIVLARTIEIDFRDQPDIVPILKQLESNYNNCYTFAFKEEKSVFFGASPERLFKIQNGFVEIDALAGSINRGHGEDDDKSLENTLLNDMKNLEEHKNVLDFVINRLLPLSEKILFDSKPLIKKFSNIQHLHSRIRAKLRKGVTVFSLFENIYPTPAVCGYPQNIALEAINNLEKFERGLYGGAIGWLNKTNCEFAVGIRSAILSMNKLRCYAGCGIVNGSDPASEFNETALKLKPILSLFENETFSKS